MDVGFQLYPTRCRKATEQRLRAIARLMLYEAQFTLPGVTDVWRPRTPYLIELERLVRHIKRKVHWRAREPHTDKHTGPLVRISKPDGKPATGRLMLYEPPPD